jgi:alanine dehydrogenase
VKIGVPAETKPGERRVALVPRDVALLAADAHDVRVQAGAGSPTGFADDEFQRAVRSRR